MKSDSARVEIFLPESQRYLLPNIDFRGSNMLHLRRALSRSDVSLRLPSSFIEEVLVYFEFVGVLGGFPSVAALFSQYDLNESPTSNFINVAPVYLKADPSRLLMFDPAMIELTEEDSLELFNEVSEFFIGEGMRFTYGSPERWYLQYDDMTPFYNADPFELRGKPLEPSVTDRRTLGVLGKVMTEAQMILHESSVNQRRLSIGKMPVNSLWFWGGGSIPVRNATTEHVFFGKDDFSASCAAFFGCDYSQNLLEVPERLEAGKGVTTIILPPQKADSFIVALLDDIFPQILLALKKKKISSAIISFNNQKHSITSRTQCRFWRATKTLESLVGKTSSEF